MSFLATEDDSGVITLVVFSVFSMWYLKEPMKWDYLAGFA